MSLHTTTLTSLPNLPAPPPFAFTQQTSDCDQRSDDDNGDDDEPDDGLFVEDEGLGGVFEEAAGRVGVVLVRCLGCGGWGGCRCWRGRVLAAEEVREMRSRFEVIVHVGVVMSALVSLHAAGHD